MPDSPASTRTYRVWHNTTYRYGASIADGYSIAWLEPRSTSRQNVLETSLAIEPEPTEHSQFTDLFGNKVDQFGIHRPHDALSVTATSTIDVAFVPVPVDDTPWEQVVAALEGDRSELGSELRFLTGSSPMVRLEQVAEHPMIGELVRGAFAPERPVVDALAALTQAIYETFEFDPNFSNVSTPLLDVLYARRGVCQDFAHLAAACTRSVGLAARYVSGYLETVPPPGQDRLIGADASHAWCSVWTPNAGWVDFDPTNNHLPVNDHITVAWGRDYGDVTPLRGVMIGPATTQHLDVSVDVSRAEHSGT